MSITKTRKKNSRFYWAELGFLALGLLGLNPTLLTDLLIGSSVPAPQSAPAQPLYGYPISAPAYAPNGAYPLNIYAPNGAYGANQAYPPSAYYQQTGYSVTQPTASTISQPDMQLLASRVGEYLSSTASQWWNSQPGVQGSQDLRPSTAGLAPAYSNTYTGYQTTGSNGAIPSYAGTGQFGAPNGYGATWQNQLPPTGAAPTVPPPSYNVQGSFPFPSTAGATYSAQLPSGAAAYANPQANNGLTNQQPNLVRGYSSNYQTLANPGAYVPAGSTANVMQQQRQTTAGYPGIAPYATNGWGAAPSTVSPPATSPSIGTGYYGRY